jgi:hypothetical protein
MVAANWRHSFAIEAMRVAIIAERNHKRGRCDPPGNYLTGYFIGLSSIVDELFSGCAECRATVLLPNQSNAATSIRTAIRLPKLKRFTDEQDAVDNVAVSLATIKPEYHTSLSLR